MIILLFIYKAVFNFKKLIKDYLCSLFIYFALFVSFYSFSFKIFMKMNLLGDSRIVFCHSVTILKSITMPYIWANENLLLNEFGSKQWMGSGFAFQNTGYSRQTLYPPFRYSRVNWLFSEHDHNYCNTSSIFIYLDIWAIKSTECIFINTVNFRLSGLMWQ